MENYENLLSRLCILIPSQAESEHFRHSPYKFLLSHCNVNLNGRHFQTRRFLSQNVRKHPVAFEQVAQGSFGSICPCKKSCRRTSTTLEHFLSKVRRRKKPDRLSRFREKRLDKARRQTESLKRVEVFREALYYRQSFRAI